MSVNLDLRVTELLASRICHDLISPVGAINNGVELLEEEMGSQVGQEAIKLIGHSADMASRRLRLFRVCYGAAGDNQSCDDVLTTMRDYVSGSRVSISWTPEKLKSIPGLPPGTAKVLLNMVIIAFESMVHGGSIEVADGGENSNKINIIATGRGAGVREESWAPLKGEVEIPDLTAKSVHPFVTGQLARHYGVSPSYQQEPDDKLLMSLAYTPAGI